MVVDYNIIQYLAYLIIIIQNNIGIYCLSFYSLKSKLKRTFLKLSKVRQIKSLNAI